MSKNITVNDNIKQMKALKSLIVEVVNTTKNAGNFLKIFKQINKKILVSYFTHK